MTPPKVFISYSHDSPAHKEWVLALANRLRGDGIDAILDQYEISPPEGWPRWMDEQIRSADFVLIVCTEAYSRRMQGHEQRGGGVGWESTLVYQDLYENQLSNKYIPLLPEGAAPSQIPLFLGRNTWYHCTNDEEYELLYRRLTNQPAIRRPALKKLKTLAAKDPTQTTPAPIQRKAFLSYVRADDHGRITELRNRLREEVRVQTGEEFSIFQDNQDIAPGQDWEARIERELEDAAFFIAIITPGFFKSAACRAELAIFLKNEKRLHRKERIIPVYYVDCPLLKKESADELIAAIASRQLFDWRDLRLAPRLSSRISRSIAELATFIRDALSSAKSPDAVLDESGSKPQISKASDTQVIDSQVPTFPLPQSDSDDTQKGRWGKKSERDGRKLSAVVQKRGRADFLIHLHVTSTDGTSLQPPVKFYLHDSFVRSAQTIRAIKNNTASFTQIQAYDSFTAGATVSRSDGVLIPLELDLAKVKGFKK